MKKNLVLFFLILIGVTNQAYAVDLQDVRNAKAIALQILERANTATEDEQSVLLGFRSDYVAQMYHKLKTVPLYWGSPSLCKSYGAEEGKKLNLYVERSNPNAIHICKDIDIKKPTELAQLLLHELVHVLGDHDENQASTVELLVQVLADMTPASQRNYIDLYRPALRYLRVVESLMEGRGYTMIKGDRGTYNRSGYLNLENVSIIRSRKGYYNMTDQNQPIIKKHLCAFISTQREFKAGEKFVSTNYQIDRSGATENLISISFKGSVGSTFTLNCVQKNKMEFVKEYLDNSISELFMQ